ncbi:MAG: aminotransferase class I/II-fold pyridoxal phosphate-dependent enzyme [Chloroflexaceae bacterium]|nr:aminotransferase class I/II-fold pyridoxal phosphate-dependent enzyme [Chloroflexaceae bacterium]NJO04534.1 aminotransferase class I/II-fold pyridoxal phosphate-dependent enzyme [Chloroflexaceae bacterium]
MNTFHLTNRISRSVAKAAWKKARGESVLPPALNAQTLDQDDVALARAWLYKREQWHDDATVTRFEQAFARWNGSKYAFAFMGGRVALSASLAALGLRAGDEVIIPGYTCVLVPNAFHYAGISTVYADIELDTYGLDMNQLEQRITPRTRAILLHHLYGLVARDYAATLDLARRYDLKVIEDCAQATGATYQGRRVGNDGDIGFYSSEVSKVFTTIMGGVVVTNDDTIAAGIREHYAQTPYPTADWIERQLQNVLLHYYESKHPQRWWLREVAVARYGAGRLHNMPLEEQQGTRPVDYNRRMPAPIAALGLNQLRKLDAYNQQRRTNAARWHQWCNTQGYRQPLVIPESEPVFLRYPVLVAPEQKHQTDWALHNHGVQPGLWFKTHIHPVAWPVHHCHNADQAVQQCINMPMLW